MFYVAANTFEKLSTFLEWAVRKQSGLSDIDHYLDDFLFAGAQGTNNCKLLMTCFYQICEEIGVPIADEKTVDPTTTLVYLGYEINTVEMSVRIPQDKIVILQNLLREALSTSKITLRELQSLVGSLAFCTRAIPAARTFNRRFYSAMSSARKPYHKIRVTMGMREDMLMWQKFLAEFNGLCYFPEQEWTESETLQLFTDSAGTADLGCGAYFDGRWTFLQWPHTWKPETLRDITFLELVPIVLAVYIWGHILANKKVLFRTDNHALADILNKKTSRSKRVMSFLRPLVLIAMHQNIQFKGLFISGYRNTISDSISRFQWSRLRTLAPEAEEFPATVPRCFYSLLHQKCIN